MSFSNYKESFLKKQELENESLIQNFSEGEKDFISLENEQNHLDKGLSEFNLEAEDQNVLGREDPGTDEEGFCHGISIRESDETVIDEIKFKREEENINADSTVGQTATSPPVEDEDEKKDVLYQHFETETAEDCLKIVEENAEHLTTLGCSRQACTNEELPWVLRLHEPSDTLDERNMKTFPIPLDSSGSFRASTHSLATLKDSCASSRKSTSKPDLHLELECRICHDADGQILISPCYCAGTSKWVHEACIIKWIQHTNTKQCEICTSPIAVKRRKKPIVEWTRPSATCGPCNKVDVWYCFFLVLCIAITICFVVLQSRYDVTEEMVTTVIFVSVYVLCGMIIILKARYFWTWFVDRSSFWGNWKNLNEEWRIEDADALSPPSPV